MRATRTLCLSLGLAAMLAAARAEAQTPAKVLKVVPSADLTQLDPGFASIVITRIYGMMIYETLFAWNSKLEPKPEMVKEWSTSADGLTWRFTLRPGLKFHDGQPVTTADVIPSLQRWMKRDVVGQKLGAAVTGMDAGRRAERSRSSSSKPYPNMLFSLGSGVGAAALHHARAGSAGRSGQADHHRDRLRPVHLQQGGAGQRRADGVRQEQGLRAARRAGGRARRRAPRQGGPRRVARDAGCRRPLPPRCRRARSISSSSPRSSCCPCCARRRASRW